MRKITIALLSLVLLSGCGGTSTEKKSEPGTPDSSSGTGTEPAAAPEPEPEPLMLGNQRYVSPCRLLGPDVVQQVYGDAGHYAHINQEIVEQSMSLAEMREKAKTVGESVGTRCVYNFDDKAQTSIQLTVDQYLSPQAARKAWKRIRTLGTGRESRQLEKEGTSLSFLIEWAKENEANAGGDPVKGLDPSILYVAGKTDFVGVRNNLLIRVGRQNYAGQAFEGKQVKGPLATARTVFAEIYRNVDDPELEQTPIDGWWEQQDGWPEFLQACEIFDQEAMTAATGLSRSIQVDVGSVVRNPNERLKRNNTVGGQAVSNECRRMGKEAESGEVRSRYRHGNADIAYAPPGARGDALLEGFVMRRLFGPKPQQKVAFDDLVTGKVLRETTVEGADAAYVFDYKQRGSHFGWLVASVGDYVIRLDATRTLKTRAYNTAPMPEPRLVAGAERMIANITAATEDADDSEEEQDG